MIGFDYVYLISKNSISFINSFKMKLSLIIGVSHMTLAIMLKGLNFAFKDKWQDFFFEFLP